MPIDFKRAVKRVPITQVRPNPWNPRKQDEEKLIAKAVRSIESAGFCGALIVRDHKDGDCRYEIIDGEHRYRALLKMGEEMCSVITLGEVSDYDAKMLTLNLNLIQGEMLVVDVASVMNDLAERLGPDALRQKVVYDDEELKELLTLADIDWEAYADLDPSTRLVNQIKRVFVFTPDAHAVIQEGLRRAMALDGVSDEADALAHVCREYKRSREEVDHGE
jgi:ParB family chromosome partitioning protein